jgi:hypothetical protein
MQDLDLAQPAIVFWIYRPGELTRFERLGDAIQSIMHTPSAKTTSIAWVRTKDCNIEMEEIRLIARHFSLTWRLSQVAEAVSDTTHDIESMSAPKRRRRRWSTLSVQQS